MTLPPDDPFGVLGLAFGAPLGDIRAARRRLARDAHPDRGGSEEAMKALNAAFDSAVAHATGRRVLVNPGTGGAATASRQPPAPPAQTARREQPRSAGRFRVSHDHPSFTIDALPVEAYEALLIVSSWIGEVLVDEPPYLLDVHLYEPSECWCRLELVPDAGSSTVSITVAAVDRGPCPDLEEVRDLWVSHLNQLGRWEGG